MEVQSLDDREELKKEGCAELSGSIAAYARPLKRGAAGASFCVVSSLAEALRGQLTGETRQSFGTSGSV